MAGRKNTSADHHDVGMIPTKYLPVIISAVVAAIVGSGGGAALGTRAASSHDEAIKNLNLRIGNMSSDDDRFRERLDRIDRESGEHGAKLDGLEKRQDTSDRTNTDALRAINQQLDYLLKNITAARRS